MSSVFRIILLEPAHAKDFDKSVTRGALSFPKACVPHLRHIWFTHLFRFAWAPGKRWTKLSGSCPQYCNTNVYCDGGACPAQGVDTCLYPDTGCPSSEWDGGDGCCYGWMTPIILDIDGHGFTLTDVAHGVRFDIRGSGNAQQIAWTALGSGNGWLALDRNGNGRVDSGRELFGNITDQPDPPKGQMRNGFLALAVFDRPENGGNADGWISADDAIYTKLRVWQDTNHNGISEPGELHTLADLGIVAISLDYAPSMRRDQFGNRFRYRSEIKDTPGDPTSRTIWDVILTNK